MRGKSFFLATMSAASLIILLPAMARAATANGHSTKAAAIFEEKCSMCHGADGTGSAMGKSLAAPDLHAHTVQSKSNAALARFISEGNGAMPAFKDQLSRQQVLSVVRYVRHFNTSAATHP